MAFELPPEEFIFRQLVSVSDMNALLAALRYLKGNQLGTDTAIELEAPVGLLSLTEAERDLLTGLPEGATIWNSTAGATESWDGEAWVSGSGSGGRGFRVYDIPADDFKVNLHNRDRFVLGDHEADGNPNAWTSLSALRTAIRFNFGQLTELTNISLIDGARDEFLISSQGEKAFKFDSLAQWMADNEPPPSRGGVGRAFLDSDDYINVSRLVTVVDGLESTQELQRYWSTLEALGQYFGQADAFDIWGLTQLTGTALGTYRVPLAVADGSHRYMELSALATWVLAQGTASAFTIGGLGLGSSSNLVASRDHLAISEDGTDKKYTLNGLSTFITANFKTPIGVLTELADTDTLLFMDVSESPDQLKRIEWQNLLAQIEVAPDFSQLSRITSFTPSTRVAIRSGANDGYGVLTDIIQWGVNNRQLPTRGELTSLLSTDQVFVARLFEDNDDPDNPISELRHYWTRVSNLRGSDSFDIASLTNSLTAAQAHTTDLIAVSDTNASNEIKKMSLTNLEAWLYANSNTYSPETPTTRDLWVFRDQSDSHHLKTATLTQLRTLVGSTFDIDGLGRLSSPEPQDRLAISDAGTEKYLTLGDLTQWGVDNRQLPTRGQLTSVQATDQVYVARLFEDRSDPEAPISELRHYWARASALRGSGGSFDIDGLTNSLTNTQLVPSDLLAVSDTSASGEEKKVQLTSLNQWLVDNRLPPSRGLLGTIPSDAYVYVTRRILHLDASPPFAELRHHWALASTLTGAAATFDIDSLPDPAGVVGSDLIAYSDSGIERKLSMSALAAWLATQYSQPTSSLGVEPAGTDRVEVWDSGVRKYLSWTLLKQYLGGTSAGAFDIDTLPDPSGVVGTDLIAYSDSGTERKLSMSALAAWIVTQHSRPTTLLTVEPATTDRVEIWDGLVRKYISWSSLKGYMPAGVGGGFNIDTLPDPSGVVGTDLIAYSDSGTERKLSMSALAAWIVTQHSRPTVLLTVEPATTDRVEIWDGLVRKYISWSSLKSYMPSGAGGAFNIDALPSPAGVVGSDLIAYSDAGTERKLTMTALAAWIVTQHSRPTTALTGRPSSTDRIEVWDSTVRKYLSWSQFSQYLSTTPATFDIDTLPRPSGIVTTDRMVYSDNGTERWLSMGAMATWVNSRNTRPTSPISGQPASTDRVEIWDGTVRKYLSWSLLKQYTAGGGGSLDIDSLSQLTHGNARGGDYTLVSDGGTEKKMSLGNLATWVFANAPRFTTVTPAAQDYVVLRDASDSFKIKAGLVSALPGGGSSPKIHELPSVTAANAIFWSLDSGGTRGSPFVPFGRGISQFDYKMGFSELVKFIQYIANSFRNVTTLTDNQWIQVVTSVASGSDFGSWAKISLRDFKALIASEVSGLDFNHFPYSASVANNSVLLFKPNPSGSAINRLTIQAIADWLRNGLAQPTSSTRPAGSDRVIVYDSSDGNKRKYALVSDLATPDIDSLRTATRSNISVNDSIMISDGGIEKKISMYELIRFISDNFATTGSINTPGTGDQLLIRDASDNYKLKAIPYNRV